MNISNMFESSFKLNNSGKLKRVAKSNKIANSPIKYIINIYKIKKTSDSKLSFKSLENLIFI